MAGYAGDMWKNVDEPDLSIGSVLDQLDLPSSDEQVGLLEAFRDNYRAAGLLPSDANPPLWRCCAHGDRCWRRLPHDRKEAEHGGVTLPWVGARFHEDRVSLLGHNLREAGGLLVELKIAGDVRQRFEIGEKRVYGSLFAYRSMRAAAAVTAWQEGRAVEASEPSPQDLIRALDGCARFQTVKCSPFDGHNSTPSGAMERICPEEFLVHELHLARPRCLIALGAPARRAIERLIPAEWSRDPDLTSASTHLDGGRLDVFCLAHPSTWSAWYRSWSSLIEHLQSRPI